jgi:hypothetical protein
MNPISPDTRSLSRGHEVTSPEWDTRATPRAVVATGSEGGPAVRLCRLERRGVAPVSRPAMWEHRQYSRTRMGAPVGKIHYRSVSERQVGTIASRLLRFETEW